MATRGEIINVLRKAYPDLDNCVKDSVQDEHIVDEPVFNSRGKKESSVANFSNDSAIAGFDLHNPSGIPFTLLQIDGRLMSSDMYHLGQCDGAIISDDDIALVEFKTDAITDDLNKNCEKAESQIFFTCLRMSWALRQKGEDFLSLAKSLSGYVCFSSYPKGNADYQNRQMKFFKKTGVALFYSNKKTL